MPQQTFQNGLDLFTKHYKKQLKTEKPAKQVPVKDGEELQIVSDLLREDNFPFILHHGKLQNNVIVLVHGLTDSPYYMRAIGETFFSNGFNVVLPLLPGHGLKNPEKKMKSLSLDKEWKKEIDNAVEVAAYLGERISLGGFSTGGALSYNKILRDLRSKKEKVNGFLFLFSAALELGFIDELADQPFTGILQTVLGIFSGDFKGKGPNPYKYPAMSRIAGLELGQIIEENEDLEIRKKISQPVFAAHSIHDTTVRIEGILDLMKKHVEHGNVFLISENVRHEEVVLEKNIKLDLSQVNEPMREPQANPMFDWMMDDAIRFFKKYFKIE